MESTGQRYRGGHTPRYSHVRMKNKVMRFPEPRQVQTEMPNDASILFSLGDQRFAIQWTVTELRAKSAEVISIQKQRRSKKRPRSTQI
jgi:hypothetical protein